MCEIEYLVDEFVCDLYCPLNCCLESEGGLFTVGDYESAKRFGGKTMCDRRVFHLRESLENGKEGMRYRQDENGVCIFLRKGKCLLHTSFGREALPYDCQEYPRNILHYMGHTEKMLNPVCHHAAKLLIDAQTSFWDYMIQVIEPNPEGQFTKRRKMILTPDQKACIFSLPR